MAKEDQFIDADTPYTKGGSSFQEILNRQIRRTADILSRELKSGITLDNETKKTYSEDLREVGISHVRVTRTLMAPFVKGDFKTNLKKLDEEIEEYKSKLGEEEVSIYGKGTFKASDIFHDKRSFHYAKLMDFKVEIFRKIFEILILAYHKNKSDIQKFSQE